MIALHRNQLAIIFLTVEFFSFASTDAEDYLNNDDSSRFKRGILTFPPNSLLQVTVGLNLAGTAKSNELGIVLGFQQNAKLPAENHHFFLPDILLAKHFSVYDHIKELMARHGFEASECLQKMICEVAAVPFTGGILEEVINFVLSPSKHENTQIGKNTSSLIHSSDVLLLLESEKLGKKGKNCSAHYKKCERSPLDFVSHLIFN